MLPVVASMKSVQKQMWFHTSGMVLTSIAVVVSAKLPAWTIAISVLLAFGFGAQLMKIDGPDSDKSAAKLFQWSITYLSVYSLMLVVGVLVK